MLLHRIQGGLRRRIMKNKRLYRLFSPLLGLEPNCVMRLARRRGVNMNLAVFSRV